VVEKLRQSKRFTSVVAMFVFHFLQTVFFVSKGILGILQ